MKTIQLIIVFMNITFYAISQSNSYNVWEDQTNLPLSITWETSGHTCFADVLSGTQYSIIVSTEIDYSTNSSYARIQQLKNTSAYSSMDYKLTGLNDNETAIAAVADAQNNQYVITGNTNNAGTANGFLSLINTAFAPTNTIEFNILDPTGSFEHTYVLDMKIVNNGEMLYYIVGYIADGTNSSSSLKKPFIACYDVNLTLVWSKVIDRDSRRNMFSAIVEVPGTGVAASGSLNSNLGGGITSDLINTVLFDYSGTELNHLTHYTNGGNQNTDADHSRVADLLYQDNPAGSIAPSIVILSYNEVDQNITLARLDSASFTLATSVSTALNWSSNTARSVGFEVMEFDEAGDLIVVGYDESAPLLSITNPNARFTFYSVHVGSTLYGGTGTYNNFDIDNTGYENLSFDSYYEPLGVTQTAPDAFFPSMAYNEYGAHYGTTDVFMGSTRLKLNGLSNNLQHNLLNNYDFNNATTHCAITNMDGVSASATSYQLPNTGDITTSTTDVNASITYTKVSRTITDIPCPSYGAFRPLGINAEILETKINIFPNPADKFIGINTKALVFNESLNISIQDLKGAIYLTKTIPNNEGFITLDIENLPTGIYTLHLTDNQAQHFVNKFIKQ